MHRPPRHVQSGNESHAIVPSALSEAGNRQTINLPEPTVGPRLLAGSERFQAALGHAPSCIALSRRGALASCDCSIRPLEDPAVVVGIIVQFVRLSGDGARPLPALLTELLIRQVEAGDAACRVVANWLVGLQLIDARILGRGRSK